MLCSARALDHYVGALGVFGPRTNLWCSLVGKRGGGGQCVWVAWLHGCVRFHCGLGAGWAYRLECFTHSAQGISTYVVLLQEVLSGDEIVIRQLWLCRLLHLTLLFWTLPLALGRILCSAQRLERLRQ